eukprot:CAMPEP_0197652834 /NCGR_PEP_ID=MMETSP1338-20131121/34684_1 /TAXON_ID=43686 ORGANISM="Pelagodinium beii, Strain RCC1491" /NCGR_SAMPLE_ID=MMETSP1338 /ASSEMBLY_ACC=CAM_ASM_000754 /LENGTH=89 /DNA_ID=CAMNT_0043227783 /DNA_START=928 /DNA_END=1197 /DNA_ORIENTATION=+
MAYRPAVVLLAAGHCWPRSKHCLASLLSALDIPTVPQNEACMVCLTFGSTAVLKVDAPRRVSSIAPLSWQTEAGKVVTLHYDSETFLHT